MALLFRRLTYLEVDDDEDYYEDDDQVADIWRVLSVEGILVA